jgi:hypothetical protein
MNIDFFKELLNDFKFDDLEVELLKRPRKEMEDILNQLACNPITDECDLLIYTFLSWLLAKKESVYLQLLTSSIMATSLNLINQSEKIAFYHGLRALELEPDNIDTMEYLLYFNHLPLKLLDNSRAISFAKEILKKNPNSKAATMSLHA